MQNVLLELEKSSSLNKYLTFLDLSFVSMAKSIKNRLVDRALADLLVSKGVSKILFEKKCEAISTRLFKSWIIMGANILTTKFLHTR